MKIAYQRFGLRYVHDHDWRNYVEPEGDPLGELPFGEWIFPTDMFLAPQYGVFGIVRSFCRWDHLSPLAQHNVRFALAVLQKALGRYSPSTATGAAFLQELIAQVHEGFQCIDILSHVAGARWPADYPGPEKIISTMIDEEGDITPNVTITLLQLRGQSFATASLGGTLIRVEGPAGHWQIAGEEHRESASYFDSWGRFCQTGLELPPMETHELALQPNDLVIALTSSLVEVIRETRLRPFTDLPVCDPETVNQHLLVTLKGLLGKSENPIGDSPGSAMENDVAMFGGAWIIACVESER